MTRRDLRSRRVAARDYLAETALTETRSSSLARSLEVSCAPNLGERNYFAEEAVDILSNLSPIRIDFGEVISGICTALYVWFTP